MLLAGVIINAIRPTLENGEMPPHRVRVNLVPNILSN
jgi:hypothetical protein